MSKICALITGFIFTIFLANCYFPMPQKMDMPNYSIGPVSSDGFPGLVKDAIPSDKGKIHVFGKVDWLGFYNSSKSVHLTTPYFSGVAALTDTDILLLLWDEDEQRYKIVERVPYEEIRFQPKGEWRSNASLTIYMDETKISIGEQSYTPHRATYLDFRPPTGLGADREKNKQAHLLFEEKVERYVPDSSTNAFEEITDDF